MIYEKKGEGGAVSLTEFEKISGAAFVPKLQFDRWDIFHALVKKMGKLQRKEKLSRQQVWFGRYFQKEIEQGYLPAVSIRWIDEEIGWGVFAEKTFEKFEFIAEYAGVLRKKRRSDRKNNYCFEYLYAPGIHSPYTIDAQDQSGIARFINHSAPSNLDSALASCQGVNHVVLFTKEIVAKGTQLTYDYGPTYWSKRDAPRPL